MAVIGACWNSNVPLVTDPALVKVRCPCLWTPQPHARAGGARSRSGLCGAGSLAPARFQHVAGGGHCAPEGAPRVRPCPCPAPSLPCRRPPAPSRLCVLWQGLVEGCRDVLAKCVADVGDTAADFNFAIVPPCPEWDGPRAVVPRAGDSLALVAGAGPVGGAGAGASAGSTAMVAVLPSQSALVAAAVSGGGPGDWEPRRAKRAPASAMPKAPLVVRCLVGSAGSA
jgi:hypothetical protein